MKPEEILIAVDEGHGRETAGKRSPDGYLENTYNNAVKVFFIQALKRNRFRYIDVSQEASDTSLELRVKRANDAKANIYLSIHYNAFGEGWNEANGVETYFYPGSKSGERLANFIYNEVIKGTSQFGRGVKSADFYVLRETTMVAVLNEGGFMTNKREADLMRQSTFQKETAEEMCKGLCKYYGFEYVVPQIEKVTVNYKVQVGSFSNKSNATELASKLNKAGFASFIIEEIKK